MTCLSLFPLLFFHLLSHLFCFSPLSPQGVVTLSQALCSSDDYSNSLLHLDLSKNPGVLSGEDATVRDTKQTQIVLRKIASRTETPIHLKSCFTDSLPALL